MTRKKKGFILIAEKEDSFKKFYEAMEPIIKHYIKKIEKEKHTEDKKRNDNWTNETGMDTS